MSNRLSRFLVGPSEAEIRAQHPGPAPAPTLAGSPRAVLAPFTFPATGVGKGTVLAIPTLQRAHDIIVSLVSALPIVSYRVTWDEVAREPAATALAPLPWHDRPDPNKTRALFLGAIASDLWAWGRAYARVTSRYQSPGHFPASFQWMPTEHVSVTFPATTPEVYGLVPGCKVAYGNAEVPYADVVEFLTPTTGVCEVAWRTIATATSLDQAAKLFADNPIAAGWLQQTGGEPMPGPELATMAADFEAFRQAKTIAALNQYVEYHESAADPSRMQLVEAREFQALELARVGNVPAYLVGAPAGTGMTYQNAQQAKSEAIDFGAAPVIATIEQTLSGPTISPAGNVVRLDVAVWLDNPFLAPAPPEPAADPATEPTGAPNA